MSVGDTLLVDGGIQSLQLLAIEGKDVTCQVVDGGVMKSRCAPRLPRLRTMQSAGGSALSRP